MSAFRRMSAITALLLAFGLIHGAGAEEPLFNQDGYRIARYRAPARIAPDGVGRIAPAAAAQLRPDVDALFIDVLPAEGASRDANGVWRLARSHDGIAGSHWFPEAGRGAPDPGIAEWFKRGVARLTHGQRNRMIIAYCLADCWMGWNAAKRLRAMGYNNVWWMAEGTDGWRDLGLPLVDTRPAADPRR